MASPFGNLTGLPHIEAIGLQNYIDNTFRLIILLYMLNIATLHFARRHVVLVAISSTMVLLSLAYAFYITRKVGALLMEHEGYQHFNVTFYYVQASLLLLLYLLLMYFYTTGGKKGHGNFS